MSVTKQTKFWAFHGEIYMAPLEPCRRPVTCILYCCSVWDSYHQISIHKLEMIQHCAAHFVLNKPWRRTNHDSITNILETLKWPPLKEHRQHAHLVLLTNNLLSIPSIYLPSPSPTTTRAHWQHKLLKCLHIQSTSNTYQYSFFRTITEWANL